jgi:hypothetical protein
MDEMCGARDQDKETLRWWHVPLLPLPLHTPMRRVMAPRAPRRACDRDGLFFCFSFSFLPVDSRGCSMHACARGPAYPSRACMHCIFCCVSISRHCSPRPRIDISCISQFQRVAIQKKKQRVITYSKIVDRKICVHTRCAFFPFKNSCYL